jgi:hypothetical protein
MVERLKTKSPMGRMGLPHELKGSADELSGGSLPQQTLHEKVGERQSKERALVKGRCRRLWKRQVYTRNRLHTAIVDRLGQEGLDDELSTVLLAHQPLANRESWVIGRTVGFQDLR